MARCERCGKRYNVPEGEEWGHPCPKCGYDPQTKEMREGKDG